MCAVSVILDYGRSLPMDNWNHRAFKDFKGIVKQAEEFDRKHDQPDCEDPEKAKWMAEVEERLRKLEASP